MSFSLGKQHRQFLFFLKKLREIIFKQHATPQAQGVLKGAAK